MYVISATWSVDDYSTVYWSGTRWQSDMPEEGYDSQVAEEALVEMIEARLEERYDLAILIL
jgi:hypothetical protein